MLYIIRGLQGSGKTTLARSLNVRTIVGLDEYFPPRFDRMRVNPDELVKAREWCIDTVRGALNARQDVVVDDVHVHYPDYRIYLEMAERVGVHCVFLKPTTSWAWDPIECALRASHPVAIEVIRRTLKNFQMIDLPSS